MKVIVLIICIVLTLNYCSAVFRHDLTEHEQLMKKYGNTAGVDSNVQQIPRAGVKDLLHEQHFEQKVTKSQPTSAVYMVGGDADIPAELLKTMCNQMGSFNGNPHNMSKRQFTEYLRSFGVAYPNDQIDQIYYRLNSGMTANFDFDRFCKQNYGRLRSRSEFQELMQVFRTLDKDGSGKLDRSEIAKAMGERNILSKEHLDAVIREADRNGDGKVDYFEFLRVASL